MSLNDSLDVENEDTYRVDFPHPRTIDNEEEFVTNSGRQIKQFSPLSKQKFQAKSQYNPQRLKNVSHPNQRNPVLQHDSNRITDSLQAELHLSLDRLSETSYDQEDLNKIKMMKSQGGRKSSIKNYPIVEKLQGVQFNKTFASPKASPNESERTVEEYQPPLASGMSRDSSTSQDSLNSPRSMEDSDDDDIRTVALEDSLSFNERDPSFDVDDFPPPNQPTAKEQSDQSDPYSHLRYNPEWRTDENPTKENRSSAPSSDVNINGKHDMDSSDVPTLGSQPKGAIIVHNESLYPSKDSPVRLSSDPSRLLLINKKYEDEFNRMLELERQWPTVAEESERSEESFTKIPKKRSTPNPRSKLKPPISYQRKTQPQFDELDQAYQVATNPPTNDPQGYNVPAPHTQQVRATPIQQTQSQQVQTSSNSSQSSAATPKTLKNFAPTPPKAPRSNKDYIELNKARLGRKSNSASYLEMYSKKNKQQEQVKASPRRPRSDSNRNVKKKYETEDIEPLLYTNEGQLNVSVEDQWREQAERLKYTREDKFSGNPQPSPRKTLREVGNNSVSKPLFSPSQVAGIIKKQEYTSPGHADDHSVTDSRHHGSRFASPRRHGPSAAESDFGDHPAFSPFSGRTSFRPETLDRRPYHMRPPHSVALPDQQYYHLSDYSDSNRSYPAQHTDNEQPEQYLSHQGTEHRQADFNQDMYEQGQQFKQHSNQMQQPSMYHQVKYEDVQNYHQSPMMKAYQQRFAHQRNQPEASHKMPLPPSHVAPLSPKRNNQDSSYQDAVSSYPGRRGFIDDPRYKMPLPPSPPQRRSNERKFLSVSPPHNDHIEQVYSKASEQISPSNRMQAVPRLPPILGAKSSPPQIDSSNDSGIMEPTPRHSISDSETTPGGYLRQHEKSKRKPTYKKYTLEDYKGLKRDINLGGLGPDLLTAKVKMGKVERARKYAEFIRQQHKSNVTGAPTKSPEGESDMPELAIVLEARHRFTLGKDTEKKKKEMQEKRERAIEYARRVPKPKVIPTVSQIHERKDDTSHDVHHESPEIEKADEMLDWELLKSLRDRHEREKAIVAEMSSPSKVT